MPARRNICFLNVSELPPAGHGSPRSPATVRRFRYRGQPGTGRPPGRRHKEHQGHPRGLAAAKDNITYHYTNNQDPTKQAQLIQDAINSHVDGIAVTDPDPQALCPTILKAKAAGIPVVMFNAGIGNWQSCGAMEYFGSDETVAGTAAGKRLAAAGAKHVLCVLQAQGQVQLEARCAGVKAGLGSEGTMTKLYVNGTDNAAMLSTHERQARPRTRASTRSSRWARRSRWSRSTRSSRRTAAPSSTPSTPTPR